MPKLYLDSRARASGTDEDFSVELPRAINLDVPHLCSFDNVAIPNVFRSVDLTNNLVYLYEASPQIPNYNLSETWRVAIIAVGHYSAVTLAGALQAALNANNPLEPYMCSYSPVLNRIVVQNPLSLGGAFAIWGSQYLKHHTQEWNANSQIQN